MKHKTPKHPNFSWRLIRYLLIFLVLVAITVLVAIGPELLGGEVKTWLESNLGESYVLTIAVVFILSIILLTYFTTDLSGLFLKSKKERYKSISIPWSLENEKHIWESEKAITESNLEQALGHLFQIGHADLNDETALFASRLANLNKDIRQGIISDPNARAFRNRITKGLLALVREIEKSLQAEGEINARIKANLIERYENRLSQKLAGRQPINLTKSPTTEGTSEATSSYFVTLKTDDVQSEIKKNFEEANGRLLITGIPGVGKTVVMLQLVLSLLQEKTHAIPVLLNLATWQSSFVKLEVWLEKILPSELGVNTVLAKKVLKEIPLILLLDGLDEVNEEDRKSCLEAIGRYGSDAGNQFAIATRKQEYINVRKDAPVYLQIEVEPLQFIQIKAELNRIGYQQPEALPLLKAMETDPVLRAVIKTPIYFNIMQLLFANGARLDDFKFSSKNTSEIQDAIIVKLIDDELKLGEKKWPVKWSKQWLSFWASSMSRKNLVVFELRDLQYDWWQWSVKTRIIISLVEGLVEGLFVGLFVGLFLGLVGGLVVGLVYGLVGGLFVGLVFGLVFGLVEGLDKNPPFIVNIETKDSINWSWKLIIEIGKRGLVFSLAEGLVYGLFVGLVFSLVAGLVFGLVAGLVFGLTRIFQEDYSNFLQIKRPYQRFYGSMRSLHFSILQHFHLRYLLYRRGLLPWKLVHFLNDMTDRHILESDGATWRFRHRIIQDYFAELWEKEFKNEFEKENHKS